MDWDTNRVHKTSIGEGISTLVYVACAILRHVEGYHPNSSFLPARLWRIRSVDSIHLNLPRGHIRSIQILILGC
jgi:hypothetical protein